jgi:arylsulfatase A-like enzyme
LHETTLFDDMPAEAHYTRWAAETAVDFLENEREKEQSFFLWVNFFDPHHPFVAPREYLERFNEQELPNPIARSAWQAPKPPIFDAANKESYAGHARGYADHSDAEIHSIIVAYYAMVAFIDDEVGRILAALDAQGLSDNTLVIFTSDHGEMLGDHGILLKGPLLSEGAVHVPLIMRWPGVLPANERTSELVELLDLCSTCVAAAGLERMPTDQGLDMLPIARDEANHQSRGWALCEYRNSVYANDYVPPAYCTMIRKGKYKLIVYHGEPGSGQQRTGELYDLDIDPKELNNLWDQPAFQDLRVELQEFMLDTLVATEDRSLIVEADW